MRCFHGACRTAGARVLNFSQNKGKKHYTPVIFPGASRDKRYFSLNMGRQAPAGGRKPIRSDGLHEVGIVREKHMKKFSFRLKSFPKPLITSYIIFYFVDKLSTLCLIFVPLCKIIRSK
jgi:hypothetical protein